MNVAVQTCPLPPLSAVGAWTAALGPGIAVFLFMVLFALNWDRILVKNEVLLEWLRDLLLHGAFYCSALLTFLGLGECGVLVAGSTLTVMLGGCLLGSYMFTLQRYRLMHGSGKP